MAEANNVSNQARTAQQLAHIDPVKAGARHAERLISQFAKKAGLGDGAAETLGSLAGPFAEQLASQFAAIFSKKGGVPTQELSKAYKQLGRLHDVDKFVAKPPATIDHATGLIDSAAFSVKDSATAGLNKVVGSIAKPGHAVGTVFDKLGLDMGAVEGTVTDILQNAGNAKANLANPKVWVQVVGQMAAAALGQPGDVKVKLAAALSAGAEGVKTAAINPEIEAPATKDAAKTLGAETATGLHNHAPTTANTGSTTGAFAVRAALLSGLNKQDEIVERTAGKVLGDVLRHLEQEPDKATKRKLHTLIKGLLKDTNSATGKTNPVELLNRVSTKLVEQGGEHAALGELGGYVKQAADSDPSFEANEGVQQALGLMAADSISELVAGHLHCKSPNDGQLTEKLFGSLKALLPAAPETEVQGAGTTAAHDISKWDCERPDIEQPFKDHAFQVMAAMGVPQNDPGALAMSNALAEIYQASCDPETGSVGEADVAVNMHAWLVENAGGDRAAVEGIHASLKAGMSAYSKSAEVLKSMQGQYDKLSGEQKNMTQRESTAPIEAELSKLQQGIRHLQGDLHRAGESLKGQIGTLQQDGFNRMRMMFTEHKAAGEGDAGAGAGAYAAAAAAAAAGAGGGGVGGPPGGGGGFGGPPGGGGPGGPKNPGMFDRDHTPAMGNVPGFNTGLRPEDEGKNLTIQQQRAIKCGEILADPSLCIEDKIFLFMMWFTAFSDQEREGKLEELVQMDRETARNQKFTDELKSGLKSLGQARESDENKLVQAETLVARLEQVGGQPEELAAAKADVLQCKSHLAERDSKIRGVEHELSDMQAKNDKAPKSREVLFMEIERLNQLRDKIMNMARSIMENSNRAIEKIFR